MQILSRAFLILGLALPFCLSAVTIETAFTRYYEDDEIRPIGHYIGSELSEQGFRSVIASDVENPEGQYFIIRLKDQENRSAIASAKMTLYATDSKEPTEQTWSFEGKELKKWLYLGITGSDWPNADVRPLAWRVELLDGNGQVLAEWKSFLWEMP